MVAVCLQNIGSVDADGLNWWSLNFGYRIKITFDNSAISSNLTNFPMPIVLSSSQTNFWSHVNRTTGSDIRFVDADNISEIYFEVEQFDTTNNASVLWVNVPQVDASSTTDSIWLYYGNSTTAFDSYCSSTKVWDTNYVGVYHLNQTAGGASSTKDSSTSAKHGTPTAVGTTGQITYGITGKLDSCIYVNGTTTNGYKIDCGANGAWDSASITVECWYKEPTITMTGDQRLVTIGTGATNPWMLNIAYSTRKVVMVNSTASHATMASASAITDGSWHYLVGFRSPTEKLYVDNVVQSSSVSDSWSLEANAKIASRGSDKCLNATLDEVRISNISRSADWMTACYQYSVDQSKFAFASEDAAPVSYSVGLTCSPTISLNTIVQLTAGVSSNVTGTITLTMLVQVVHRIPSNLTGTVSLSTSVQVSYQISLNETNSISLNLTEQFETAVPPNLTGVMTLDTLVQTSYHIPLSETQTFTMNTSIDSNLSLHENGSLTLDMIVKVDYGIATTETQSVTFSQSEGANYSKSLSLSMNPILTIAFSGNYTPSGSMGTLPSDTTRPKALGQVFDVRIVRIAYIYRFQQFSLIRSVVATMNMTNAGTISGDAVVDWWIIDATQRKIITRSETVFIGAGESRLLVCTFDLEKGDYVFNTEVKSIAGNPLSSPAIGTLGFSVGYIYTDFLKDNFVLILIVCFIVIICALSYRRRKRKNSARKRKRHRRK